jgi:hypothetical protein
MISRLMISRLMIIIRWKGAARVKGDLGMALA